MPRQSQIIPKYIHPHTEVYINDNTEYKPATAAAEQGIRSLHVFASRKGRDGKIILKKSVDEFIKEYGQPQYKPYGQACYMPYGALSTGDAECYCMRVMPDDAMYSNVVLVAKYAWLKPGDAPLTTKVHNPDFDPSQPNPKPNPLAKVVVPCHYGELAYASIKSTLKGAGAVIPNPFCTAVSGEADTTNIYDPFDNAANEANPAYVTNCVKMVNIYADGYVAADEPVEGLEFNIYNGHITMGNLEFSSSAPATLPNEATTVKEILPGPAPTFHVRYEKVVCAGIRNQNDIIGKLDLLYNTETPDADGWFSTPILYTLSQGRGAYGDFKKIRLTEDVQANKSGSFMNYIVEVLDSENGLQQEEVITRCALSEEGTVVKGFSYFLPDLINDPEKGSSVITMDIEYGAQPMFDAYNAEIERAYRETITVNNCSLLTFKPKGAKTSITDIKIDTESVDAVSLDGIEGIALGNGDDGSFNPQTAGEGMTDILEATYAKAFRGEIDKSILSKRRTPCEFIYDANYHQTTKSALASLILKRGDAQGFIDLGIIGNVNDLQAMVTMETRTMDRLISYECQNFNMRDPFTGKRIPMTTTFELARRLPTHCKSYGAHVPFTGTERARLTGMIRNELYPVVDGDDSELKELLYTNRINYYEAIGENFFIRGTQTTSQNIWSDLSEENNMRTLLAMKRDLENMVADLAYDFADIEERKKFTESADRMLDKYRNMCRECSVNFDMNEYEEENYILHCYLSVIFKTMAKVGIIEIDINPRV